MSNQEHLGLLKKGVNEWNKWRIKNSESHVYLYQADLREANLKGANLKGANLIEAKLDGANLNEANLEGAHLEDASLFMAHLSGANLVDSNLKSAILYGAKIKDAHLARAELSHANLMKADLSGTDLSGANLHGAILAEANLSGAVLSKAVITSADLMNTNLSEADLSGASLYFASCIETNFDKCNIENCKVYGISTWNLEGNPLNQNNLIITRDGVPEVTIDNLKVAQFIYLMLNNEEISDVLGTIAKKGVLILGRFTPERKKVLDAIRGKLRELNFLPMMFDFDKVAEKDFTETIKILAGMSRFVIADITEPKSSPLELQATVPDYKIPFLPIIKSGERPFSMFADLTIYPWMLDVVSYDSEFDLLRVFKKGIIDRAIEVEDSILKKKETAKKPPKNIKDFE